MDNRPDILIGIIGSYTDLASGKDLAEETAFGIEEEGCLCSIYDAGFEEDIRFSGACVTVMIGKNINVYCKEASNVVCVVNETEVSPAAARKAGHMAARLLKMQP